MIRTQIYITDEQARKISDLALSRRLSKAEVIRRILNDALETGDAEAESTAVILATAGALAEAPDWPDWLNSVRGRSAVERLDDLANS